MGLFHDICPVCGNKVPKKARVCSNCGHGAPGGWIKCPACGKWVGNDSNYCPQCNHPLHPEERLNLAGGVWDRSPDCFAQRFELGDVRFIREQGLQVQEGTSAILIDGGKFNTILKSGRHSPEGALRTINWFGNPPPRSVVMVESGDVVLRLDFPNNRASDETPVGVMAELTIRFSPALAADFLQNTFKDARSITFDDVAGIFRYEAESAVRNLCQISTIEDLVKDPERRERFEDAVANALKPLLARSGFEFIRVGAVEFTGPGYEKLRASYGDLEEKRRKLEFDKKALELVADEEQMSLLAERLRAERQGEDAKETAHREKALADYLAQIAQEKGLSELALANEMEIARKRARGELMQKDAELAIADELIRHNAEMTALAHAQALELSSKTFSREELLREAENKAQLAAKARAERLADAQSDTAVAEETFKQEKIKVDIERLEDDREFDKARKAQELLRQTKAIKTEDMKARIEAARGATAAQLAFASDDAELRAQLLQQELAKAQLAAEQAKVAATAALTPEQLLAQAAASSPAAAEALAKMHTAGVDASAKVLEEMKQLFADRQAHDEKQLQRMADLAQESIQHQNNTIVPPVAPAAPTIVH